MGGGIIQTIQKFKGDTATTDLTSYTDISGMAATITPTSTSSKVLVSFTCHFSSASSPVLIVNLVRGSTNIAQPTVTNVHPSTLQLWLDAGKMVTQHFQFLDSPSTTSATTYKLQWKCHTSGYDVKINGYYGNDHYNTCSTMILQEVSA